MTYYGHPAREADPDPGEHRRECRVCGVLVIGLKSEGTLRHHDENVTTVPVPREYLDAVRTASEAIGQALSQVPASATDGERARAAAVAVFSAGLLRQRVVKPGARTRA